MSLLRSEVTPTGASRLFQMMGLGGLDIGWLFIVIFILLIVVVVLLVVTMKRYEAMKSRYDKFMGGKRATSLEERMQDMVRDVERLKKDSKAYANDIDLLFTKHEGAIQKIGLLKYDAFREMGGNLSYCLALLDEKDNGVMINTMHSNTGSYSYTKRIKNGTCDIELSPEEQEALRRATGNE
ncbi:MAG: DUF4446 family protein [Lachnospiraceae bacterium]|nr:DUF4446 family protein [Lachnospiraceae bacterium]